jgi:AcrR family transcriptional regulator
MPRTTPGRRERKKAQTRQALADAALRLFVERGFDNVGVKEVAEAADVSLSTLFHHFPSKEALVFDEGEDLEGALVAAVRDRPRGQPALEALRDHLIRTRTHLRADAPLLALIESTPALRDYAHRMWLRHEGALSVALSEATGLPANSVATVGIARFALDIPAIARRCSDPAAAIGELFELLSRGWATAGADGPHGSPWPEVGRSSHCDPHLTPSV